MARSARALLFVECIQVDHDGGTEHGHVEPVKASAQRAGGRAFAVC